MALSTLPDLISAAQTTEEEFLRHIFVRDQMADHQPRQRRRRSAGTAGSLDQRPVRSGHHPDGRSVHTGSDWPVDFN